MTDISIVIVNFNNSKLLKDCLNSINTSTHKAGLDIILVDNASKDDSVKMVKENFKGVRVIENKENLGFIKASNQGLRVAAGRYSMLLNDDTIVQDGAFDKMLEYMDKHKKVGAVGPKLLNVDRSAQRQGSILGPKFWKLEHVKEVDFLVGACLMVRKEAIEQAGILDENFLFYNDDLDWCRRIRKAGWKTIFYPEAHVIHYGGYSSTRKFNRRLFVEGFRGGLYFCRKHYGALAYIIYRILLPVGLIFLALTWIISFPFKPIEKKKEYPQKFASLWEIFMIDLVGRVIPPRAI
ncbi:glycosyltransferase family 2 protein [Candidatus Margulisiibacteriota bacterium]